MTTAAKGDINDDDYKSRGCFYITFKYIKVEKDGSFNYRNSSCIKYDFKYPEFFYYCTDNVYDTYIKISPEDFFEARTLPGKNVDFADIQKRMFEFYQLKGPSKYEHIKLIEDLNFKLGRTGIKITHLVFLDQTET